MGCSLGGFDGKLPHGGQDTQMDRLPEYDIESEREDLLQLLDRSTGREVKEAIQLALSALPKPTQWITRSSKEGTFDASSKRDI